MIFKVGKKDVTDLFERSMQLADEKDDLFEIWAMISWVI